MVTTLRFHFHRGDSLAAKLIRWRNGSDINHVSIEFEGRYYDANFGKALTKSYMPTDGIVFTVEFTIESYYTREKVRKYLESSVGKKYDRLAIIGFILNKTIQSRKRLYCSEHASRCFDILTNRQVNTRRLISPDQLMQRIRYYKFGLKDGGAAR